MRIQDIIIGKTYRFHNNPTTGYAKAIAILKPGQGVNTHTYSIVRCEHTMRKNDSIGFIRYFKASSLKKQEVQHGSVRD